MRCILLGLLLIGWPVGDLHAQPDPREELLRLTRELFETMLVARDPSLFERVALEQVRVIPPGGIVESREQAIAGVAAFEVSSVAIDRTEVIVHGGTATVVGRVVAEGRVRGVGELGPMRFMNVFVSDGGEWRLLARSLTPCAARAIAAGRC